MDTPYWLDKPRPPLPSRSLNGPPDVAVVGGGITGCSCALALARADVRVRLYEAREIASGASGRNGGFALRGGAAPYDVTAAAVGREQARTLWQATEGAPDRMERLCGDAFRRTGSLRLAADEEERETLRAEYEALREDGFAADWRGRWRRRSPGGSPRPCSIRRTARSSLPTSSGGSQRQRPRRAWRSASGTASMRSTRSRPTTSSWRPTAIPAACSGNSRG